MTQPSVPKTTFSLRPGHAILHEIKRILLEQVDYALYQLTTPGLDEDVAVHEARKAFKRIRAILRLVRDEIDHEDFSDLNALFRDAGRRLSGVRTSAVLDETLEKLHERYPDQLSDEDVAAVLARLRAHHEAMREEVVLGQALFDQVAAELRRGRKRMEKLHLSGNHFPASGLRRVYARGRRGLKASRHAPTVAHFHEWRKRVKYLRYQVRILSPAWPEVLACLTQELVTLSELLGVDHDLAELHHTLVEHPDLGLQSSEQGKLLGLIEDYREELEARSFHIGARVYVEKPGDFVDRMAAYWRIWTGEHAQ